MRSSAQFGAENFICSIEFIEKRILWATKKHTFVRISRRKHCYYHTYLWHLVRCMEDMAVELLFWQEWVANIDMNPMYNCKKYLKIWKQKNHQLIIWVGVISIFEAKQNKIQKMSMFITHSKRRTVFFICLLFRFMTERHLNLFMHITMWNRFRSENAKCL